jgi:general secretion pathway protein D
LLLLGRAMRVSKTTLGLALAMMVAAPAVGFGATRPPAAPAAASPADSTKSTGSTAAAAANSCRRLPAGKRMVKLNLKPDTSLPDLVAWISAITCKDFLISSGGAFDNAKVTIVAPELLSTEDAYRLFLNALDSVGLTVYPSGKFMRIIESSKAKSSPIPSYVSTDDSD